MQILGQTRGGDTDWEGELQPPSPEVGGTRVREPQNHPGAGRGTPELVLVQEGQEERLQGPDPTSPAPGLGRQAAQPRKVGGTGIRERQSHPSTRRASQGLLAGRRTEQIRGCRSRPVLAP